MRCDPRANPTDHPLGLRSDRPDPPSGLRSSAAADRTPPAVGRSALGAQTAKSACSLQDDAHITCTRSWTALTRRERGRSRSTHSHCPSQSAGENPDEQCPRASEDPEARGEHQSAKEERRGAQPCPCAAECVSYSRETACALCPALSAPPRCTLHPTPSSCVERGAYLQKLRRHVSGPSVVV